MVKRTDIRNMKRAVASNHDAEAMAQLLRRSVRFCHKRLALLRCLQAERMGIHIQPELLAYCREIADAMPVAELHALVHQAGTR